MSKDHTCEGGYLNCPKCTPPNVTHAMVIPWPVSQGLKTWCGYDFGSDEVKDDFLATSPEVVTCPRCAEAMRSALANLKQWVQDLNL